MTSSWICAIKMWELGLVESGSLTDIGRPPIDLIHKSQNAPVPYATTLHSKQRCAHFCSEWSIVGYGTGAFWDLWNWFIHFWDISFLRIKKIPPHDDVIKWKHFPRNWPFVRGIHRSGPGEFPTQRPVTPVTWINRWVNNHEAGDLRRYRAHYDVIVMDGVLML